MSDNDTEAIQNLKSLFRSTLRIITDDSRAFIGTFVGTDKSLNILLINTEEFRLGADANPAGRFVGQVMIPWRLIRGIGLQVAGESDGVYHSEQVRRLSFQTYQPLTERVGTVIHVAPNDLAFPHFIRVDVNSV